MAKIGEIIHDTGVDTWNGGPDTFERRWKRNGTPIAGATGESYTTTHADVGKNITLGKQAHNEFGGSAEVDSNPIEVSGYNESVSAPWVDSTLSTLNTNVTPTANTLTTMPISFHRGPDDAGLIASTSGNKYVVPSTLNGRYIRMQGNMGLASASTYLFGYFRKNAAYVVGCGLGGDGRSPTSNASCNILSAPIQVATGDEITMHVFQQASVIMQTTYKDVWMAAEVLPEDYSGCLVYPTSDRATLNNTYALVTFDAESYDHGGYWDAAQPTRLTATATGRYRISGLIGKNDNAVSGTVRVTKNGSLFSGSPLVTGQLGCKFMSAVISMNSGDYLEVEFATSSVDTVKGFNSSITNSTWVCFERIPDDRPCALIYSSGADIAVGSGGASPRFDTVVYDDASLHEASSLGFRIPQGVTKIRATLNQYQITDGLWGAIYKNGSLEYWGCPRHRANGAATEAINLSTPIINVVPGDLIQVSVSNTNSNWLTANSNHQWFCIECLGDYNNIPELQDGDPDWSDVIFMSGFEGTSITDEGPQGLTTNINSRSLSQLHKVVDDKALYSSTGGDWTGVTVGDASSFDFAANEDFTIDCMIKPIGGTSGFFRAIWGRYLTNGDLNIWHMASGSSPSYGLNIVLRPEAGNVGIMSLKLGYWHHVRVCRSGDNLFVFLDGCPDIVLTGWSSRVINFGGAFCLMGNGSSTDGMNGAMDEFKAWRGVAKNTTSRGFNPPRRQSRE